LGSTNTTFTLGMLPSSVLTMAVAAFVAPFLLPATARFVLTAASLPDVSLAVITSEPAERLSPELKEHLDGHWRVDDALDPEQLIWAVRGLSEQMAPVERLVGALEQLQVPMAYAREQLGLPGMDVQTALNVRDKSRMKTVLRAAGVPCARHQLVTEAGEAYGFAEAVGFPLVAKPPAGAGAQATYRLDDVTALRGWVEAIPPRADAPGLLEEFLVGEEHTFDSVTARPCSPRSLTISRRRWRCSANRGFSGPSYYRGSSTIRGMTASGRSGRRPCKPLAFATR
jgi:hypothetical protein